MRKTSNKSIPRPVYLERITPYIGKNIIKVLVGQRRVGKYRSMSMLQEMWRELNMRI